jgi:hypothetical protein
VGTITGDKRVSWSQESGADAVGSSSCIGTWAGGRAAKGRRREADGRLDKQSVGNRCRRQEKVDRKQNKQ